MRLATLKLLAVAIFATKLNNGCKAFMPMSLSHRVACGFTSGTQHRQKVHSSTQRHMLDSLATALVDIAQSLGKRNSIQPSTLQKVRRALLDADVNLQVCDTLLEGVRTRSLTSIKGVSAEQQFIKAMYDELVDVMGGTTPATLAVGTKEKPAVVLLAGLQGAGKTTAAGKLALYLKEREVITDNILDAQDKNQQLVASRLPKRQRKVLLVAADVYRPAAIKQLQVLGESIGIPVFTKGTDADPVDIVLEGIGKAKAEGFDTVIVDTAGRQVIDTDLMSELQRMQQAAQPDETLLVVDAMTGQEAAALTAAFDAAIGLTGAILTKMDGDSRGGAAVSVRGVSGKPIKFVGVGEKTMDLEPFYPDRMASRILGMGDVVSLVEKAAAEVSDAEALKMQEKMKEATFDFDDFLQQSELISKMGSFGGIAKLMPGMAGQLSNERIREVEQRFKVNKSLINSMTKKERKNPDLFVKDRTARSRIIRITKGSGRTFDEGAQFMSEFQRMRTMMSRMQKQMNGEIDPAAAMGSGDAEDMLMSAGNRASRRAAKKSKNRGKGGGGGGFGK
jgi:signal recognition particle subunit SRP54